MHLMANMEDGIKQLKLTGETVFFTCRLSLRVGLKASMSGEI